MTSKIKVNILADGGDNSIITSDGAGSFTASSGLASSVQSVGNIQMTPAFEASLGSNQTLSNNTHTKMQANTETFDTDNCYDNSTNYRFTPTKAGKYLCYGQANIQGGTIGNLSQISLRKNGSTVVYSLDRYAGDGDVVTQIQKIIDFNGSSDYLEVFIRQNSGSSKDAFATYSFFGAYRIIGA